jgi:hypothetical protein
VNHEKRRRKGGEIPLAKTPWFKKRRVDPPTGGALLEKRYKGKEVEQRLEGSGMEEGDKRGGTMGKEMEL